jgi:multidrug efflux pump subunit AcrA (membrane-fusion protein)
VPSWLARCLIVADIPDADDDIPDMIEEVWDYKISFMAPEGISVKPGQPVLGFDTSELERQLLDKKAERDSAQKELEKKQTDLEITRRDQELQLAEAQARLRKASLKVDVPSDLVSAKELASAREDLDLARREVAYLKEHLRLQAAQGGTEADAGRLTVGQRVSLRLDAHPDDVFTGRVRSIGGAVQSKSEINPLKVVKLDISLDRTDSQRMRPGMRFLGTVEIERVAKALVAPVEVVFNRPDGPVIYRRKGWGSELVRPVLGRHNDRLVEIRQGLAPGDRISRRDLSEESR